MTANDRQSGTLAITVPVLIVLSALLAVSGMADPSVPLSVTQKRPTTARPGEQRDARSTPAPGSFGQLAAIDDLFTPLRGPRRMVAEPVPNLAGGTTGDAAARPELMGELVIAGVRVLAERSREDGIIHIRKERGTQ